MRKPRWLVLLVVLAACATEHPEAVSVEPTGPAGDPGAYSFFLVDQATGSPVRYNPCQPLHFVINPAGAPPGGVELAREAAVLVGQATGIAFVDDGLTQEASPPPDAFVDDRPMYQPDLYGAGRWAPVLIGWLDLAAGESQSSNYGKGGSAPWTGPTGHPTYVTGNATVSTQVPAGLQKLALMHELGHVVGLNHVDDPEQIMSGSVPPTTAAPEWGAGDLAGLAKLGRDAGCLPEVPTDSYRPG